jgi:acetyl-CoA C-acetyltransferase
MTALGGKVVVNPSGGLKSKGHPVGATGIAQIREAVLQLRGECGDRQVRNAARGLVQNMGGTGARSVIHIFEKA